MAVLGPGGEWIKKKTNEITKGLIQQYQNFTSQSPQQTIGRLNGDGTATLPDGSIVEVVERGTPGLYCILYNMGGGKWLADLPKPRHINVDGQIDPSVYALITVFNQQADPESYIGTYSFIDLVTDPPEIVNRAGEFTNICGLEGVWLSDLLGETTYQIDPSLYSEFGTLTPNIETYSTLAVFEQPVRTTIVRECPIGDSSAQIFVENWINGDFYRTYRGDFGPRSYTGPNFILSTDCKDILIFRANLNTFSYNGLVFNGFADAPRPVSISNYQYNLGEDLFFLEYKILKDIYVDRKTNYIKCRSSQYGKYIIPETNLTNVSAPQLSEGWYTYPLFKNNKANMQVFLSRDEDNQPEISMFITTDYRETSFLGPTTRPPLNDMVTNSLTNYGRRGMIIRHINTSPQIVYDVDLAQGLTFPEETGKVLNSPVFPTLGYFFRGKFTGCHASDGYENLFRGSYERITPVDFSFADPFPYPGTKLVAPFKGNLNNIITDSAYIPSTDIDFSVADFDFSYASPPTDALKYSKGSNSNLNSFVNNGIDLGKSTIKYNELFLTDFFDNFIASRLTESSYAMLVPYIGPGSTSTVGIFGNREQRKTGLAVFSVSNDGEEVVSVRMVKNLVDKDYLNSVVEERIQYITALGQKFRIYPSINIGVGLHKI